MGPAPEMVRSESVDVAGASTSVALLVPRSRPRAVLLWYHGWPLTTTDPCAIIGRKLAERMGCAIVLAGCDRGHDRSLSGLDR